MRKTNKYRGWTWAHAVLKDAKTMSRYYNTDEPNITVLDIVALYNLQLGYCALSNTILTIPEDSLPRQSILTNWAKSRHNNEINTIPSLVKFDNQANWSLDNIVLVARLFQDICYRANVPNISDIPRLFTNMVRFGAKNIAIEHTKLLQST